MKFYRFTFIHGNYDVGQAVVAANSWEEADEKLRKHCKIAHPEQGYPGNAQWNYESIKRIDPNNQLQPMEINDDVVLTYGVDG